MGVLLENPNRIFLETGPGRTLSVFALRHPDKKPDQAVLTSIRHPREDRADRDFLLAALGRLWVLGAEPDWQAVHSKPVRRILLPAYPFERKPYWIKPHSSQTDTPRFKTGKNPDLDEWFYLPSWKRSLPCSGETLSRTGLPELTAPKTWLIFADKTGQGRHLAEKLKKAGQTVAMAHKGPDFTRTGAADYTINPEEPSGYDALFRELQDQGLKPAFILHLWNLDPAGHNPLDVKQMLDQGIYSLLYLVQTLGRRNFADPLTIMVIGSGTQEVTGEEELCPIKAALLGPVKVIPLEYPNIQCRYIDVILPGLEAAEQLSGQIIAETLSEHSGPVTAFRGNYRWIPDIEPVRLPPQTRPRLREGGTYLITGGLGGMGLSIAGYIAENFRANLILTGRSEFPDESKWEVWVSEHGEHHPVSVKILKLKTIRAAGSPVLICRADAADPDQMKKAVDQAHERFGGIHGLIHTAGLADQAGVIQRRTREMTEQVLAPKIMGTLVLEQVLKNETLDFIFLCSSLGNILYHTKFGQAAYNAANEFLDLYACYQARTRGPFTVSVNWDDWSEAGMSAAALSASADGRGFKNLGGLLKEVLSEGLSSSEGTDVFRRIADSPFHRIAVSTQDLRIQIEQEALKTHMILETVFQKRASGPAHARPDLSTAYAAPKDEIETTLSDIWGELLGIQGIGVHDNFFDLGGDSLIATQVLSRIREAFDTPITLNEFFENPTIKGLARTIFEENIKTQDQDEMARLLAEIEGMSEDEAARRLSESM
jgi:NAD(P)-dependent dehydrogenase (short-subunit alcohol dehydrogenase family)/acyl carrier protein